MAPSLGSVRATPTLQSSEPPHEGTPTVGGLLAIPPSDKPNQNPIALRAICSVRLLARIGSWGQLKNMPPVDAVPCVCFFFLIGLKLVYARSSRGKVYPKVSIYQCVR